MLGPTTQSDPSREIYVTKAYMTLQFIPTTTADIMSGMNVKVILPARAQHPVKNTHVMNSSDKKNNSMCTDKH